MLKYVIERNIPDVGKLSAQELQERSRRSNQVIRDLGGALQWVQSYVTSDKIFCVYLAENKEVLLEHAAKTGLPANNIAEVKTIIDPTTAG